MTSERPAPTSHTSPTSPWFEGLIIEHFASKAQVESFCNQLMQFDPNRQLHIVEPWMLLFSQFARSPAELQALRHRQQQRQLDPQHLEREALRQANAAWNTAHKWNPYTLVCRHCAKSAKQSALEGHPLDCPQLIAQLPTDE